jgi:hypothetical protein
MSHSLIIGRTLSGKSALAKQIGSQLRIKGAEVLAYNPTLERGYARIDDFGCIAAEYETDDPDELIAEIVERYEKEKKKRILILDEAHELPASLNWLTTKGRHYGLTILAISQRGAALNATFRTQIGVWYVFRCSGLDMKMVEEETGVKIPKDDAGSTLKPLEYLKITINGVEKRNLKQKTVDSGKNVT